MIERSKTTVYRADIVGLLPQYGPLAFYEIQWWGEGRHVFRLFRYSVNGCNAPFGLRMDMDKKAFLDDPEECPEVAEAIHGDASYIWDVAVRRLQELQP